MIFEQSGHRGEVVPQTRPAVTEHQRRPDTGLFGPQAATVVAAHAQHHGRQYGDSDGATWLNGTAGWLNRTAG
ncbi:hypothetical protein [Micromonospora violae]|uniref:hypothetical protein n=1 Tax=Micromonospora violae TaxID=1278207 RepID=UPI0033F50AF8